MRKYNKNKRFFIFLVGLALVFAFNGAALAMESGFKNDEEQVASRLEKKRKFDEPSQVRPKNLRTQALKLNLIYSNSCPLLFKEIINECNQAQSEEEDARLVDVWCKLRSGYYFFYGRYQDSQDSLWFADPRKLLRIPISAYSALDDADKYLQKIFKRIFPRVYSCLEKNEDAIAACKKEVVRYYKIHLMPKQDDLGQVIKKIIQKCIECSEFRSLIKDFKVASNFITLEKNSGHKEILCALERDNYYMPVIVIYPRPGKFYAQKLLNMVFDLFGDAPGLDITPRFNKKISSLIYYAQGNGDDKIIPGSEQYFETDFIHFKSDFTGEDVDYKLEF